MSDSFGQYKGCSVLITGGLGFIGSNLAHKLVELGDVEVSIIDALVPGQGGNLHNIDGIRDRVKLYHADMGDDWVINHAVSGVDYIFNLAGNVSHLDSMIDPRADMEMNCAVHLKLLEACRNFNPHAKIIFASTRQVYGEPRYLPVDEKHEIAPLDINGIHKRAAELYHLLYYRVHGQRAVCLRLTNTYGPRQLVHHNRQGFIPWFIHQAIDHGVIELYGGGKQKRDLVYVDDVVEALLLAGASGKGVGEVFNLGGQEPVSLAALANELIAITGHGSVEVKAFPPERQLIDIGNFYADYQKIHNTFGWQPRTDWREGLRRTVEFYLSRREFYWKTDDPASA